MLDGELVAWKGREQWFPNIGRRVLHHDFCHRSYAERRDLLVGLGLDGPGWATSETFEDGEALFTAVCEHGLEGVVAKKHSERYRPGERRWLKMKNPNYWRRESEIEGVRRSRERRRLTLSA